ncbi:hypothetical protein [Aureimonas sp. SK2]|uniref:hypothetical protein n=1 Tax=Aureimonas sp. SK2 TaxID=3015992 RepID=UPI0024441477|nr:hypothetical protein [Aureimonas sp. SK2]
MSEIKRVPLLAAADADPWLDWEQEKASDLLQHLRSDNLALGRLRDALLADGEPAFTDASPA